MPVRADGPTAVQVFVFQSVDSSSIPGARVFVIGSKGQELFATRSDSSGIAVLPSTLEDARPSYIFAELPSFYVTGTRWSTGTREYNLPLQVIGTIDRAPVKIK